MAERNGTDGQGIHYARTLHRYDVYIRCDYTRPPICLVPLVAQVTSTKRIKEIFVH